MSETKDILSLADLDNVVNQPCVTLSENLRQAKANQRIQGKPFLRQVVVKKIYWQLVRYEYPGDGSRKLKIVKTYKRKPKGEDIRQCGCL